MDRFTERVGKIKTERQLTAMGIKPAMFGLERNQQN